MFSIYAFDKKWYRYVIVSHVEEKQVFFTFRKLAQFINIGMRITSPWAVYSAPTRFDRKIEPQYFWSLIIE